EKVASATTLNTMAWQLAVMLGIALSTVVVEASAAWQGRGVPAVNDYAAAFLMLAVVCLAAMPCYRALPEDAGSELSGHSARTTGLGTPDSPYRVRFVAMSAIERLDELYERPGFLLRRAHQIFVSILEAEFASVGLSPAQYAVLVALNEHKELSQGDV